MDSYNIGTQEEKWLSCKKFYLSLGSLEIERAVFLGVYTWLQSSMFINSEKARFMCSAQSCYYCLSRVSNLSAGPCNSTKVVVSD